MYLAGTELLQGACIMLLRDDPVLTQQGLAHLQQAARNSCCHADFQENNASLGSGELQALAGGGYEVSTSPDSQGPTLQPPLPSPPPPGPSPFTCHGFAPEALPCMPDYLLAQIQPSALHMRTLPRSPFRPAEAGQHFTVTC